MKLIILRGPSGCGKSTKARQIMSDFLNNNEGKKAVICSADQYFVKDGVYKFDHRRLGAAHFSCKVKTKNAMRNKTDLIILDNTNTTAWEMEPYLKMASRFGYKVEKITVGSLDEESLKIYAKRNVHSVPLETIKKQAGRFEE